MPTHDPVQISTAATSGIVKYGFGIEYRDLEAPRTGIFDGLRLVIDPDVGFEMQCFLPLHLFGHSAQWVAPSLAHKLEALQRTDDRARFMQVLHDYEFEAWRIAPSVRPHKARSPSSGLQAQIRTDALPRLQELLQDKRKTNAGDPVSVAEAARRAVARISGGRGNGDV